MSRIGNKLITIPAGVEVTVAEGNEVTVKGPKGTLTRKFSPLMGIEVKDGTVTVTRPNEDKHTKQLHGTTRALIATMIEGCEKNYTKVLQIIGIGYRAAIAGNKLTMNLGYSHPIEMDEFAANVRAKRKPEPYGGKGVRYKDEHVRRKEGKTAAAKK